MNNDTQQRFKSFVINAHDQPPSTKHLKERFEPNKRKHEIRIAIEIAAEAEVVEPGD